MVQFIFSLFLPDWETELKLYHTVYRIDIETIDVEDI